MSWDTVATFLLDPRLLLVPMAVAAVFATFLILKRGSVSLQAWGRLWTVQAFILPLVLGILYGPQWPNRIADAMGGGIPLEWEAVIAGSITLLAFVAFAYSVKVLLRHPSMAWVGLAFVAYSIGVWTHVILRKGEPFVSYLGGGA